MNFLKTLAASASILVASFLSANAAVLVTDFGTGSFTITHSDFTSSNQSSGSLQLIGDDFGSAVYGNIATPFDMGGSMDSIYLTASYTGTSTARFDVALFDADGDSLNFSGYFSSFTPGVQTTLTLSFNFAEGVFNGPVRSVGIITNGLGDSVNLTVYDVAAIPEPSTIGLLVLGATGALYTRRRKSA